MVGLVQDSIEALAADSQRESFDAIVVGGGTSGLAVAATLIQGGRRVALIEAGPANFLSHLQNTELRFSPALLRLLRDQVRYRPALAGGGYFGTNFGCLGGRGLFWNGATPRFSAVDFAAWPAGAVPLEEDFSWAETQFRVTRSFGQTKLAGHLAQVLQTGGMTFEPGPYAVETGDPAKAMLGSGIASAFGFLFRLAGNAVTEGRLRIVTNQLAERILLDGGLARGVAVKGANGPGAEILGRSVVLAAGGIESIKLAALSEIPDPGARIGKGLQEHIFYHALLEAPQHYDQDSPDTAILFARASGVASQQWELHAPGNRMFTLDDGSSWCPAAGPPYQIMIRSFAGTEKRDANHVVSSPGGLGSATVHFSYSDRDRETMGAMRADAVRIAKALGASAADAVPLDAPERIRAPGSSYHEAGGLDMGTFPDQSVTDADGVFHAVRNLVCADAASFPMIGATNPHLTILASARRKARALNERLAVQ